MNRTELADLIAEKHDLSKAEAARVLTTLTDAIVAAVASGDGATLPGFGTFKVVDRPARAGRNPSTGAAMAIAASRLPKFTPGSAFKAAVDPAGAASKLAIAANKKAA